MSGPDNEKFGIHKGIRAPVTPVKESSTGFCAVGLIRRIECNH
jgi:hypothetical protein